MAAAQTEQTAESRDFSPLSKDVSRKVKVGVSQAAMTCTWPWHKTSIRPKYALATF